MILFSTAKPSFVLRQLTHSCPDGKPSGHSLSSLRRQLERLVGKMCVLTHTYVFSSCKAGNRHCAARNSGQPLPTGQIQPAQTVQLSDGWLLSVLFPRWSMAARPNAYTSLWSHCSCTIQRWIPSSLDTSTSQEGWMNVYQECLSALGQADIWSQLQNLQCCTLLECPYEMVWGITWTKFWAPLCCYIRTWKKRWLKGKKRSPHSYFFKFVKLEGEPSPSSKL